MLPLIFLGLLVTQTPAAQEPQGRFTSRSDLVVLHVAVLDSKAEFVPGLPREAFTVYDTGRPQTIGFFEDSDSAVTVGLVLDSSISMHRNRDAVIAAGISFAEASHPDDEMFTINFNEHVWPGLPRDQPFTSDREALKLALRESTARGRTALFDALRTALRHLDTGHRQKKVLIVVSDGGDNASTTKFDEVLAMALRMNAVIYTLSIHDQYNREGNKDVLRKLAAVTGGEAYFPTKVAEATRILDRIARDIRSGYTIGYVPETSGGGYRAIRVDVRTPDRRKLTVRARSGYVAGAGGAQP